MQAKDTGAGGVFAEVLESIVMFREALEGEPGQKLATIGADPGTLADIVRATIRGLHTMLTWLRQALVAIDEHVIAGNAMVALIELGDEALEWLQEGLILPGLSDLIGASQKAVENINDAIAAARDGVETIIDIADSILPASADVVALNQELDALLGPIERASTDPPGLLVRLMERIWA